MSEEPGGDPALDRSSGGSEQEPSGAEAERTGGEAARTGAGGTTDVGGASAQTGGRVALDVVACPGAPLDAGGAAGAAGDEPWCTGVGLYVDPVPTDVVIVLDRSAAMAIAARGSDRSRWEEVNEAISDYLANPESAPHEAALVLFGAHGTLDVATECDALGYVEPFVGFTAPESRADALIGPLQRTAPTGLAPLTPALLGALELAREHAASDSPLTLTSLVVLTASDPTACDGADATAAVAAAWRDEGVRTHVIGIGEVALEPLDALAAVGGTSLAMWVDETDLGVELASALRATTTPRWDCRFELPEPPPGLELDFGETRVSYRGSGGEWREALAVAGSERCDAGGYYLDDPTLPQRLFLCPCTCMDATPGMLELAFACAPAYGDE